MKKLVGLILCATLALGGISAAFAEEVQPTTGAKTQDTHLIVQDAPIVYNVTIAWDSLDFTYDRGAWNPSTHKYGTGTDWDKTEAYVTLTNHSNATVGYAASFDPSGTTSTSNGATITISNETGTLATAVGTQTLSAPSAKVKLAVTGKPDAQATGTFLTDTVKIVLNK